MKASQRSSLEKLYRRVRTQGLATSQLLTRMTQISRDTNRTVGVLIDRQGAIADVIVGDAARLYLPDIGRQRAGTTRLRGLRLLRTGLSHHRLSPDDFTDLRKLRLDAVATVEVGPAGFPRRATWAHLAPGSDGNGLVVESHELNAAQALEEVEFLAVIDALEAELRRALGRARSTDGVPGVLVYVRTKADWDAEERIAELHELARTAGLDLVDTVIQQRFKADPRTVVGRDKLEEIELRCLDLGAEILLFGRDLTPGQVRAVTERTELKVIDRTQLILDIFAQHAKSRDGKLQVELAQLKYAMPRLIAKNTAMSRLTGGIGGRGPGETKLEINRRRARDRVHRLEKEIKKLSGIRTSQRKRRRVRNVPIVSIVGYTNAGKSTLLNTLTNAEVLAQDKLFATLDPTSRRLRFPKDRELVLTDTVGFIHDLPKELTAAFKATLEELEDADLLIHLIDASAQEFEQRMEAVNEILRQLELHEKPQLLVFNKADLLDDGIAENLAHSHGGLAVSAVKRERLAPLVDAIKQRVWAEKKRQSSGE